MAINHKYEGSVSQVRAFWRGLAESYYNEGLSAPPGQTCPHPKTSFAASHWRRGAQNREQAA